MLWAGFYYVLVLLTLDYFEILCLIVFPAFLRHLNISGLFGNRKCPPFLFFFSSFDGKGSLIPSEGCIICQSSSFDQTEETTLPVVKSTLLLLLIWDVNRVTLIH